MSGPCHFVLFGATGHLTSTKLLPSLFDLELAGCLDPPLEFIAFARRDWTTQRWRKHVDELLTTRFAKNRDARAMHRFIQRFEYVRGDHMDPAAYQYLLKQIDNSRSGHCENVVIYLAISPVDFIPVIRNLADAGLNSLVGKHRIVVEKPFGSDLGSARKLNAELHRNFKEDQIYRIDHYLGKEAVQNLFVFRFANSIIEPLWNRHHIDHVQITVAEESGVGERAGYFEQSGTLRDMVQNHLLQLLTLVAMEPPVSLDADDLRDEKVKVLKSIREISANSVDEVALRAQYDAGEVNGATVMAYKDEPGVKSDSKTETYAAIKFHVDNWRWRGVPFYLRSGKRLALKRSTVAIRFRDPPHQLFSNTACEDPDPNWLVLTIQPEERIRFELKAREPGLAMVAGKLKVDAAYKMNYVRRLDAYATLLLDVIEGDRSLFIRFDEAEMAWRVIDPVLEHWREAGGNLYRYPAGSWGPLESSKLFEKPYQSWRNEL